MDLESTWISEQAGNPLSKKESQEVVVKEILTSLEERSESITGVSPNKEEAPSESKLSLGQQRHPATSHNPGSKHPKKGLIVWIKSLFR